MRFALTPEQLLSRDALRELLRSHCTPGRLRAVFESSDARARVPGLWSKLNELGIIGALAPESLGGMGLDVIDLAVLLEETGRAAVPEPIVETAAVAVPLLAAIADQSRAAALLARVLSGDARVVLAFEGRECVATGEVEAVLGFRGDDIHLAELAAPALAETRSVDATRRQVSLDRAFGPGTLLASGARPQQLAAAAFDAAALGTAAQLVGLGARMLDLTLVHVRTREQFGRPIGAFQAVKHQIVDAHVAIDYARPLVYRAAHSVAREDPARSLHVSMAKSFASDAALLVARKALQLHGAIGYSYEYDLQLYMKRAWALAAAYGDAIEHRARIAEVTLIPEGERDV